MPIDPVPPVVQQYLDSLVPPRPEEMVRMEEYARRERFPIIGPSAGFFCYQIARMIGARRIFELGSGYGYSTAWFARAVRENGGGVVHHVVWDEELSAMARRHLSALGYDGLIEYSVGEAVETLRGTEGPFDLIFNDIDKEGYPDAFPVIDGKLRRGGVLLVDNMLFHGRIFDEADRSGPVEGIRRFTESIMNAPGWVPTIAPIRDGVLVAWKA